MRTRALFAVAALAVCAGACTNSTNTPDPPPQRIATLPQQMTFNQINASSQLSLRWVGGSTPPPDTFWHAVSTNPTVAVVTGSGPNLTVTAVANGNATIHITLDTVTDTADVPVTVSATGPALTAYNGTWKGDANLKTTSLLPALVHPLASCPGSLGSYGETLVIDVSSSGAGTVTMKDTAGFDRPYQVTIPSNLTFTGSGTFSLFGAQIPGQLAVTINSLTQLTFQETTTYGNCSNTYGGQLTKQ